MTDDTVVMTFPKSSIVFEGDKFIQIDTKLTREELLVALMRSEAEPIAVIKGDKK